MRNPLRVPVSETTVEELSAQAHHHAVAAALGSLDDFHHEVATDPSQYDSFGATEHLTVLRSEEDAHTDAFLVIPFDNERSDSRIVFFSGASVSGFARRLSTPSQLERMEPIELLVMLGDQAFVELGRAIEKLRLAITLSSAAKSLEE